jgi:hypothetical protein
MKIKGKCSTKFQTEYPGIIISDMALNTPMIKPTNLWLQGRTCYPRINKSKKGKLFVLFVFFCEFGSRVSLHGSSKVFSSQTMSNRGTILVVKRPVCFRTALLINVLRNTVLIDERWKIKSGMKRAYRLGRRQSGLEPIVVLSIMWCSSGSLQTYQNLQKRLRSIARKGTKSRYPSMKIRKRSNCVN